jgi:hypothetical protein
MIGTPVSVPRRARCSTRRRIARVVVLARDLRIRLASDLLLVAVLVAADNVLLGASLLVLALAPLVLGHEEALESGDGEPGLDKRRLCEHLSGCLGG